MLNPPLTINLEELLGGSGKNGKLELKDALGKNRVIIGEGGQIAVIDDNGKVVFHLKGSNGTLYVGAEGNRGYIILKAADGASTIRLNGDPAAIAVGAKGHPGTLSIAAADGTGAISMRGNDAKVWIGKKDHDGNLFLRSPDGATTIHLNANNAGLRLGTTGHDGDLYVVAADNKTTIHLNADGASMNLGTKNHNGSLTVRDRNDKVTVRLDGQAGDIILSNADCAEEFDMADDEEIEPGMVMVLDEESRLRPSRIAYDKKVAGVISGAGQYKPGIVLDRKEVNRGRKPIALVGKVFCRVDASYAPINVGDLLTTSQTLGHAMKATNPMEAFGAVIGKALTPLQGGRSLIPILIALQ